MHFQNVSSVDSGLRNSGITLTWLSCDILKWDAHGAQVTYLASRELETATSLTAYWRKIFSARHLGYQFHRWITLRNHIQVSLQCLIHLVFFGPSE